MIFLGGSGGESEGTKLDCSAFLIEIVNLASLWGFICV